MESSNEHIPLVSSTNDSFDSDHSSDSNHSMEEPPSMDKRVPPKKSLIRNIHLFTSLFDSSISELQDQINKLRAITERVEKIHRNAIIGSLIGGVIGVVGGIMTIVGLALTPVTLGASLMVTGVGIEVVVSGGLAGATANITDMIHQKVSQAKLEKILKTVQGKLSPILENLTEIKICLGEIQKDAIGGYTAGWLFKHVEIVKVATLLSGTVRAGTAVTGVLSGLFLVVDVFFIVQDANELNNIDNDQKDGNGKSAISKFIKGMNDTVGQLTETLDQLQEVRNKCNA